MWLEIPADHLSEGKTRGMATDIAQGAGGAEAGGVDEPVEGSPSAHLTLDDRIWLLRAMLMMRGVEERAMTLYRQGKVPGSFYDGYGQEAVSAGAAFAMAPEDRCASCTVTWRPTSSGA